MRKRMMTWLAAAAVGSTLSTGAFAATLGINFTNNTGNTEPGFESYVWGSGDSISNNSDTFASPLGQAGQVGVAINSGQARMRSSSGGPVLLNDLTQGFLFSGPSITLTDLNPGVYELSTYHHDRNSSVDNGLRFAVTGANGSVFRNAVASGGSGSNPAVVETFQFSVDSSGTATIASTSFGGGAGGALNGLLLNDVTAAPTSVGVDFGPSSGHTSPAGFIEYIAGPVDDQSSAFAGSQAFAYSDAKDQNVSIGVTMNGSGSGANRATDRGGSDPLFRDVLMTSGNTIGLTLNNLLAGTYDVTLFHGTDGSQFTGNVDVFVNGLLHSSFAQEPQGGFDLLGLQSDGINPLLIEYKKASSGAPSWLHLAGLQIDNFVAAPSDNGDAAPAVPEPASAALAMLALGGLALRRRHA